MPKIERGIFAPSRSSNSPKLQDRRLRASDQPSLLQGRNSESSSEQSVSNNKVPIKRWKLPALKSNNSTVLRRRGVRESVQSSLPHWSDLEPGSSSEQPVSSDESWRQNDTEASAVLGAHTPGEATTSETSSHPSSHPSGACASVGSETPVIEPEEVSSAQVEQTEPRTDTSASTSGIQQNIEDTTHELKSLKPSRRDQIKTIFKGTKRRDQGQKNDAPKGEQKYLDRKIKKLINVMSAVQTFNRNNEKVEIKDSLTSFLDLLAIDCKTSDHPDILQNTQKKLNMEQGYLDNLLQSLEAEKQDLEDNASLISDGEMSPKEVHDLCAKSLESLRERKKLCDTAHGIVQYSALLQSTLRSQGVSSPAKEDHTSILQLLFSNLRHCSNKTARSKAYEARRTKPDKSVTDLDYNQRISVLQKAVHLIRNVKSLVSLCEVSDVSHPCMEGLKTAIKGKGIRDILQEEKYSNVLQFWGVATYNGPPQTYASKEKKTPQILMPNEIGTVNTHLAKIEEQLIHEDGGLDDITLMQGLDRFLSEKIAELRDHRMDNEASRKYRATKLMLSNLRDLYDVTASS